MATPTPTFDPNEDLYALLGVGIDSTDKEISSAYRKKARDVHPDKNPDPAAAVLFHKLKQATSVLLDEKARAAYDNLIRARLKRKQRDEQLDANRKRLRDELFERERKARDKKMSEDDAQRQFAEQLARMRAEAKDKKNPVFDFDLNESDDEDGGATKKRDAAPSQAPEAASTFSDFDNTVQLKWSAGAAYDREALTKLLRPFGKIDTVVMGKKGTTALVAFSSVIDAHALVLKAPTLADFHDIKVSWASGSPPAALGKAQEIVTERIKAATLQNSRPSSPAPMGRPLFASSPSGSPASPLFGAGKPLFASGMSAAGGSSPVFSSFASAGNAAAAAVGGVRNKDYESLTLMRMMQQQERQRLVEKMEQEEAQEK